MNMSQKPFGTLRITNQGFENLPEWEDKQKLCAISLGDKKQESAVYPGRSTVIMHFQCSFQIRDTEIRHAFMNCCSWLKHSS